MALDGLMLSLLKRELSSALIGARVDKIYQPAREELVLAMRAPAGNCRLFLSARASAPRAHLTSISVENPAQPPMFCMLLRKQIGNARLVNIRQEGFERVLLFDFDTVNEFGDPVTLTLAAEIMGRYSNLVLIGADGRILDAVKRVGADRSSLRQILPGLPYEAPPPQDRISVCESHENIMDRLKQGRDIDLHKLLQETLEGISPLLSREITSRAFNGRQITLGELTKDDELSLAKELAWLSDVISTGECNPTMILTPENEPKDFSFVPIEQYGSTMSSRSYESISELLDAFYGERDAADRMKQKMSDFSRTIQSRIERIERKLAAQKEELLACKDRDALRKAGDLLSANCYLLEKGMTKITVQDFYDEECKEVTIKLDPRLTPTQNIQHYYKEYRKADTAEKMLLDLISQGEKELLYLDSEYDLMTRARTEAELSAIRAELGDAGYLRANSNSKKLKTQKLAPHEYISSDGYRILSGRSNIQNELLTHKESEKHDIWLHTQKIPGSHTILITNGEEPPARTYTEAAIIAATNSKARGGARVAVDYTAVKNVKKMPGGKPGMVVYDPYYTAYVAPDEELCEKLRVKGDKKH